MSTPDTDFSSLGDSEHLLFHPMHGTNSAITNSGRTAIRPNATGEFNDAIVMSNRPLKDNELFEVIIERMVDRWSGSIEAGNIQIVEVNPDLVFVIQIFLCESELIFFLLLS